MEDSVYKNISKIIERDSKSSTYKYALLRGVIDIIQDNSPFITFTKNRVYFPLGSLIEKWLIYYYPILEGPSTIPQINGDTNLAFELQFKKLINEYSKIGGFSVFYNDLKNKGIAQSLQADFLGLVNKMRFTITDKPMRHIGFSISKSHYSIFKVESSKRILHPKSVDVEYLIETYGTFSIPDVYYEAFKVLGSFICGQDSILFKWAEFCVNASNKKLTIEKVMNEVLKNPITERDIKSSKKIYEDILRQEKYVECVWTGEKITTYNVDHVIPFSVWKNNDLWNLLPSRPKTNNQKRDKIPSPNFIKSRKPEILRYWNLINEFQSERFQKEIRVALIGRHTAPNWQDTAIEQLQQSCNYLIKTRGYQEWEI